MNEAEFPNVRFGNGVAVSNGMGVVTNIHLCALKIPGPLETMAAAFCPFVHLREFKVTGSNFTGPLPRFLADCFPHLKEIDVAFGALEGPIPDWVGAMRGHLVKFKARGAFALSAAADYMCAGGGAGVGPGWQGAASSCCGPLSEQRHRGG